MHKKIIRKIVVKVLGNRIKKSPPKGHCQEMKCVLGREKTYFKVLWPVRWLMKLGGREGDA